MCWLGVYVGSSVLSKEGSVCCRGLTVRRPTGPKGDTLCGLDIRIRYVSCLRCVSVSAIIFALHMCLCVCVCVCVVRL